MNFKMIMRLQIEMGIMGLLPKDKHLVNQHWGDL